MTKTVIKLYVAIIACGFSILEPMSSSAEDSKLVPYSRVFGATFLQTFDPLSLNLGSSLRDSSDESDFDLKNLETVAVDVKNINLGSEPKPSKCKKYQIHFRREEDTRNSLSNSSFDANAKFKFWKVGASFEAEASRRAESISSGQRFFLDVDCYLQYQRVTPSYISKLVKSKNIDSSRIKSKLINGIYSGGSLRIEIIRQSEMKGDFDSLRTAIDANIGKKYSAEMSSGRQNSQKQESQEIKIKIFQEGGPDLPMVNGTVESVAEAAVSFLNNFKEENAIPFRVSLVDTSEYFTESAKEKVSIDLILSQLANLEAEIHEVFKGYFKLLDVKTNPSGFIVSDEVKEWIKKDNDTLKNIFKAEFDRLQKEGGRLMESVSGTNSRLKSSPRSTDYTKIAALLKNTDPRQDGFKPLSSKDKFESLRNILLSDELLLTSPRHNSWLKEPEFNRFTNVKRNSKDLVFIKYSDTLQALESFLNLNPDMEAEVEVLLKDSVYRIARLAGGEYGRDFPEEIEIIGKFKFPNGSVFKDRAKDFIFGNRGPVHEAARGAPRVLELFRSWGWNLGVRANPGEGKGDLVLSPSEAMFAEFSRFRPTHSGCAFQTRSNVNEGPQNISESLRDRLEKTCEILVN